MGIFTGTPGARRAPEQVDDPLPRAARAKLLALRGAAADARDASTSAQARLNDLQSQRNSGALLPERADATAIEIDRLEGVRAKQNERHRTLLALVDNLHRFIQALPRGIALEMVKQASPKLPRGQTLVEALASIRNRITATRHHLNLVRSAALPKAAMKEAAKLYVAELAKQGRPQVGSTTNGLEVTYGTAKTFAPQGVKAAAALLCWLDSDAVLKRLFAEIDAIPEAANAMSVGERDRRIVELTNDFERLNRQEEALIEKAADEGVELPRRPDALPAAVLGVRIKQRARVRVA